MEKGQAVLGELQYDCIGQRFTPLRIALIETFSTRATPLSLEDLKVILLKRRLKPHRASLYREIDFLIGTHVIEAVHFPDGKSRYEYTLRKHHHHLVCTKCYDIVDIPFDISHFDDVIKQLAAKTKFYISTHSLEFSGLCPKCQ